MRLGLSESRRGDPLIHHLAREMLWRKHSLRSELLQSLGAAKRELRLPKYAKATHRRYPSGSHPFLIWTAGNLEPLSQSNPQRLCEHCACVLPVSLAFARPILPTYFHAAYATTISACHLIVFSWERAPDVQPSWCLQRLAFQKITHILAVPACMEYFTCFAGFLGKVQAWAGLCLGVLQKSFLCLIDCRREQ